MGRKHFRQTRLGVGASAGEPNRKFNEPPWALEPEADDGFGKQVAADQRAVEIDGERRARGGVGGGGGGVEHQPPVNFGARFSLKASTASLWSAVSCASA